MRRVGMQRCQRPGEVLVAGTGEPAGRLGAWRLGVAAQEFDEQDFAQPYADAAPAGAALARLLHRHVHQPVEHVAAATAALEMQHAGQA